MPKYKVYWTKTYHSYGDIEVEATSFSEAQNIVRDEIGNYEGSIQYDPDADQVKAYLTRDVYSKEKRNA